MDMRDKTGLYIILFVVHALFFIRGQTIEQWSPYSQSMAIFELYLTWLNILQLNRKNKMWTPGASRMPNSLYPNKTNTDHYVFYVQKYYTPKSIH